MEGSSVLVLSNAAQSLKGRKSKMPTHESIESTAGLQEVT